MFCDLIARTIFSPSELAIGTVTAVFGAPVVIWLMISRKNGEIKWKKRKNFILKHRIYQLDTTENQFLKIFRLECIRGRFLHL